MKLIIGIFIATISIFSSFSNTIQAQNNFIEKHLKAATQSEDFTSINLSLSGSLANEIMKDIKKDLGKMEGKFFDLIKNLTELHVLTTEKDAKKHYDEALALIKKDKFTPLMTVKEGDELGVNILTREGKNGIDEVLLLVGEKDEFVLVSFSKTK